MLEFCLSILIILGIMKACELISDPTGEKRQEAREAAKRQRDSFGL